jgi:hypothetical protein
MVGPQKLQYRQENSENGDKPDDFSFYRASRFLLLKIRHNACGNGKQWRQKGDANADIADDSKWRALE